MHGADLGATRMAATIVINDPVFGRVAYGGDIIEKNGLLYVTPKDGLRRKLYYRDGDRKLDIELNRDGFKKEEVVVIDPAGKTLQFHLENRTNDAHELAISCKGLKGIYELRINGKIFRQVTLTVSGSVISIPVKQVQSINIIFNKVIIGK